MVWPAGFEPATPCSQSRCATELRHGQSAATLPAGPSRPRLAVFYGRPMTAMRSRGGRIAIGIVAILVALGAACGSDGDDADEKKAPRTSSTLILPDGGPDGGFTGPVAVAGYDSGTGALVVVRGGPPDTRIIVDEATAITVQGSDGPQPLPVAELAGWLAERQAGLPGDEKLVPMTVVAEGSGDELHLTSLAEVPPG